MNSPNRKLTSSTTRKRLDAKRNRKTRRLLLEQMEDRQLLAVAIDDDFTSAPTDEDTTLNFSPGNDSVIGDVIKLDFSNAGNGDGDFIWQGADGNIRHGQNFLK